MKTLDGINLIGLTGQSGSGKTTVSKLFESLGIAVINCDDIAKKVAGFPAFLREVSSAFPDCVDDIGLNRRKMAATVFNNPAKMRLYSGIIYPYITAEVFRLIRENKSIGKRLLILDAPTLFESGLDVLCCSIISVIAPFDVKMRRILERDGIPVELAKSRISSQHDEEFFRAKSEFLIINDGGLNDLERAVTEIALAVKGKYDAKTPA